MNINILSLLFNYISQVIDLNVRSYNKLDFTSKLSIMSAIMIFVLLLFIIFGIFMHLKRYKKHKLIKNVKKNKKKMLFDFFKKKD